jgi:hypothetical protein
MTHEERFVCFENSEVHSLIWLTDLCYRNAVSRMWPFPKRLPQNVVMAQDIGDPLVVMMPLNGKSSVTSIRDRINRSGKLPKCVDGRRMLEINKIVAGPFGERISAFWVTGRRSRLSNRGHSAQKVDYQMSNISVSPEHFQDRVHPFCK